MNSNANYEMLVNARIVDASEFKAPEATYTEINIDKHETTLDIIKKIKEIRQASPSGNVKIKIPKGYNAITDTVQDIFYSWNEEGLAQAIFTGVGATATAVGAVAIMGLSTPITVSSALTGYIIYATTRWISGKVYDGIWNYGEQIIDAYKNQDGTLVLDTSVSNLSDLRELVTPLYGAAADCDLNEIEVRVKPENEGDEPLTYLIEKGDTVWDLCQKYDTTYDELIELNPWLSERFSDDKEFCLIRPGETLKIPCKGSGILDVKPTYDGGFKIAGEVKHVVDPMFLDLNKDGVLGTTSVLDGIYFDHEGDGFAESSAWVDKEDGVLVIDKNNDGKIDNGNEVFGDNYVKLNGRKAKNGFEALADLDSNGDGKITSADGEFDKIKVLKGNGELVSLDELGIVSINLNKTEVNKEDGNKNVLVYEGTFVYEDGSTGKLGTFNLGVDKMLSEEVNKVEVSDDVKVLPDVKGYGKVHSLHQAMMLDESGSLKSLVQDFVNTEDIKLKKEIVVDILHKWTGADKIRDNSRGEYYSAQKLHILEKFMGVGFVGLDSGKNPNNQASYFLKSSFNVIDFDYCLNDYFNCRVLAV